MIAGTAPAKFNSMKAKKWALCVTPPGTKRQHRARRQPQRPYLSKVTRCVCQAAVLRRDKPVDLKGWIRVVVLAGRAWPYEAIGQPVCSMQE